jgi:hypothetical protein
VLRASWLTAPRVRRLAEGLSAVPSAPGRLRPDDARLHLWRRCGGPIDEVPSLIDVLVHAELVARGTDDVRLTRAGRRVVTQRAALGYRPLALALLQAGLFHAQARNLIETSRLDEEGNLVCPMRDARRVSPQLVGLLQHWPSVATTPAFFVPAGLVGELDAVWTLLPPPDTRIAALDTIRKSIGNRAELYSYQYERLQAEVSSSIVWVAQDDDTLGYDIEDRGPVPRRHIEVKGSGATACRFFLSDNEWRTAHVEGASYEIHFWGGIDLNRPVAEEFTALRAEGFPLIFFDLAARLADGALVAVPQSWRVSTPPPLL